MNRKYKALTMLALLVLSTLNLDALAETRVFQNLAISNVQHQVGNLTQNDLVIKPYTIKSDLTNIATMKASFPASREDGEPLWTITPQQLPMNDEICLMADASLCKEQDERYKDGECIHSCISGGAEVLAYDKKASKLYLFASSTAIGTGGGAYFLYVADLNKKEIKFLKTENGPFTGDLSPSGTTLLMYGWNSIAIYNILTGKEFVIFEENNWDRGHEKLHYMGFIHWLRYSP